MKGQRVNNRVSAQDRRAPTPTSASIKKLPLVLYRLIMPGGLLLFLTWLMVHMGFVGSAEAAFVRFYTYFVFGIGLLLSAFFKRSRLFFALLIMFLAERTLTWLAPGFLSATASKIAFDIIAVFLPLDLLALAYVRERGIISPAGRRRLVVIALQIAAVAVFCKLAPGYASTWFDYPLIPRHFVEWSSIPQPGMLAFFLAGLGMIISLIRSYKPAESSLFWSLVAAFTGLQMGNATHLVGVYFATGGLILIIAVLETSYAMAYHDELTQLPSRRSLNETLLKLGDSYVIGMLDVDHFKKFNDSYGHAAGDQALRMVASKLARIAGGGKAFRYGGEEFTVVFSGKSLSEAFTYLDTMRKMIEQSPFVVRGKDRRKGKATKSGSREVEVSVTVSIGLAARDEERTTPDQVIRFADKALYKAKAKGRNRTVAAKPANEEMRIVSMR